MRTRMQVPAAPYDADDLADPPWLQQVADQLKSSYL